MTGPATPSQLAAIVAESATIAALAQNSFDALVAIRRASERSALPGHDAIHNVLEFVALWQFELCTLQQEIAKNSGTFRGQVFIRCALLSVYSSAHAMKTLLGRRFQDQFAGYMRSTEWSAILGQAHSDACRLYRRCEREFGTSRNAMVAHRDLHPETRLAALAAANERDVTDRIIDAYAIVALLAPATLAYLKARTAELEAQAT